MPGQASLWKPSWKLLGWMLHKQCLPVHFVLAQSCHVIVYRNNWVLKWQAGPTCCPFISDLWDGKSCRCFWLILSSIMSDQGEEIVVSHEVMIVVAFTHGKPTVMHDNGITIQPCPGHFQHDSNIYHSPIDLNPGWCLGLPFYLLASTRSMEDKSDMACLLHWDHYIRCHWQSFRLQVGTIYVLTICPMSCSTVKIIPMLDDCVNSSVRKRYFSTKQSCLGIGPLCIQPLW